MIVLGIETSCDETSVAIVKNGQKILSNVVYSSLSQHKKYGGVIPEIASRSHLEEILPCLQLALKKAKLKLTDVDAVAITQGPGLLGSLLVGVSSGKALAYSLGIPFIGVDHVIAHVYSAFLHEKNLRFPFLGLVVSGGHTSLIKMSGPSKYEVVGKTLDDAAGEAFDKVAKIIGLRYPGGPEVDKLSRGADPGKIYFNRPMLSQDSLDFSFSGIKTAVLYKVQELKKSAPLSPTIKKQICAGFQESMCDVLLEKTKRALKKYTLSTVVVGGGVSANSRLRQKFKSIKLGTKRVKVIFPPMDLCQDNAAMIAALGSALLKQKQKSALDMSAYPNFLEKL